MPPPEPLIAMKVLNFFFFVYPDKKYHKMIRLLTAVYS